MRSTRALERAAIAIACALIGSGGCRGALEAPIPAAHPDDETPRRGGTLHLASFGDVPTLDPALAFDALSVSAIHLIFAGLVDFDDRGNVVPDLAERVELSSDALTYRFPLRHGVIFQDGAELTAGDVKRSFDRAIAPATASPTASYFDRVASVDVEGRYLVAIHLKEADATFLSVLAMPSTRPVCPSVDFAAFAPCGAGPFAVREGDWKRGQGLRLVRHDRYFRPGEPYLDAIEWELNVALVTEGYKFARGDLDVVQDLTQADSLRYLEDPRWKPFGEYAPARSVSGDAMNVEIPPFDNVEVRRAVASAIDREHLALLKSTNLTVANKPVPPGFPGYDPDVKGQTYDLDAARAHMKNAGLEHGWPAPIPYVVYKQALAGMTAQVVQQDLEKIGLHLALQETSYPTYLAITRRRGKAAMSPQGQTEDYPDPIDFLDVLFTKSGIADDGTNNYAFYSNDALEALVARARRTIDPLERARLYADAERIVCDDAPWAFEYAYRFLHVRQPYVRGYRAHPVWSEDVARVWIDRAGADGARTAMRLLGPVLGGAR